MLSLSHKFIGWLFHVLLSTKNIHFLMIHPPPKPTLQEPVESGGVFFGGGGVFVLNKIDKDAEK